jgi:hydrogenase 4, membrane subunit
VQNAQPLPFSMTFVLVILMVMSVCSSFIAAYWLGLAG